MRHDDVPDARVDRRVDDREDLVAPEVAGREHEPVPGDDGEHGEQLGQRGSVAVDHRDRRSLDALLAQLGLDPRPQRLRDALGILAVARAGLVHRVDGGQPDDAGALARGDLDGQRIQAADRGVQRQRPDDVDPGHRALHDLRALGGRRVVRLQREPAQAELEEPLGERDVVDAPRHHVGPDVHVQVVGRPHELAGAGRRL